MKKRNTQAIGEILRDFFEDNTELYEKILEIRVKRAWYETLGSGIRNYTHSISVKDRVLHVSLTSAVLRNEVLLNSEQIIKRINDYTGIKVIEKLVVR